MNAYCSACGTLVPNIDTNHHVCVPDGTGGYTASTRDDAAKARVRADREHSTVGEALAKNIAEAKATRP